MASKMQFVPFNNGEKFPIVGLGTWKSEPGKVKDAVKYALEAGYKHIDCAFVYGNEAEVGEALDDAFKSGLVKREDIYVTSKLWNTFHKPELVSSAFKQSLNNLKLDCLDLYLIHWPMAYKENEGNFPTDEKGKTLYSDVSYVDTWKEMEKLVRDGLVKSIGVSNFNSKQIKEILKIATIKPVVNQVECHPYLNQNKLKTFCESENILLTAYSTLGSGDRPWAKADNSPVLLDDPKLKDLAQKYNKSPAQILIKFQIQRGIIALVKSVNKERIIANLDVFDFSLSEEDLHELNSWDRDIRYCHLSWASDHTDYPFLEEF